MACLNNPSAWGKRVKSLNFGSQTEPRPQMCFALGPFRHRWYLRAATAALGAKIFFFAKKGKALGGIEEGEKRQRQRQLPQHGSATFPSPVLWGFLRCGFPKSLGGVTVPQFPLGKTPWKTLGINS